MLLIAKATKSLIYLDAVIDKKYVFQGKSNAGFIDVNVVMKF